MAYKAGAFTKMIYPDSEPWGPYSAYPPHAKDPHQQASEHSVGAIPSDAKARKDIPLARGALDYFPNALAAVAELSRIGNEQHNPGEPMHWAKDKSIDHADSLLRHLVDRGKVDGDKVRHSVKVAWRGLALAEIEILAAQGDPEAIRQVKLMQSALGHDEQDDNCS